MNMNKILAAGLMAAVSSAAFAQCGNGGFYVGANAGVAFTKMKVASVGKIAEDKNASVNKKKTKFLADLVFGYDHRINDVMLGVDLTFGMTFGKTKVMYNGWMQDSATEHDVETDKDFLTLKNTWNIALMPRIGYLVMPQLEIYATAGVKAAHYKLTYSDEIAEAGDKLASTTAKKVKFLPVVGAGLRYEITPDIFAKLEYNYEFKKGVKMPADLAAKATADDAGGNANSVKVPAHVVKLGVGFRF